VLKSFGKIVIIIIIIVVVVVVDLMRDSLRPVIKQFFLLVKNIKFWGGGGYMW
jgi:hypothetical protein